MNHDLKIVGGCGQTELPHDRKNWMAKHQVHHAVEEKASVVISAY
jgi:hypothetical protein